MILSSAQLALGVALLLAAPIFWTLINAEDTRGQKMGPHPGIVTVIIAAACIHVAMSIATEAGLSTPWQFAAAAALGCFVLYGVTRYVTSEYL